MQSWPVPKHSTHGDFPCVPMPLLFFVSEQPKPTGNSIFKYRLTDHTWTSFSDIFGKLDTAAFLYWATLLMYAIVLEYSLKLVDGP